MAKVFCNRFIEVDGKLEAQNGATRRTLVLINKTGFDIQSNIPFEADLGFLNKGNHSFVFVNEPRKKKQDTRILFVVWNTNYGVTVHNGKPLFKEVSIGGYGNAESTLAVVPAGCIIEKHTYKNRNTSCFEELTLDGFKELSAEEAFILLGERMEEI